MIMAKSRQKNPKRGGEKLDVDSNCTYGTNERVTERGLETRKGCGKKVTSRITGKGSDCVSRPATSGEGLGDEPAYKREKTQLIQ